MSLLQMLRPLFVGWSDNSSGASRLGKATNQEEAEVFQDALGPDSEELDSTFTHSLSLINQDADLGLKGKDGKTTQCHQEHLDTKSERCRKCRGCMTKLDHERLLTTDGSSWHFCCFRCQACYLRVTPEKDKFIVRPGARVYHESCHKELKSQPKEKRRGKCFVCNERFTPGAQIKFHQFWRQEFCPVHDEDGTTSCCSCERLEPRDIKYVMLDDGRKLCQECFDSAIMDTTECQALYFAIKEFLEGLGMKLEQEIPLFLVQRQALYDAMDGDRCSYRYIIKTRGQCLFREQNIDCESDGTKPKEGNEDKRRKNESLELSRRYDGAILITCGLPRLLAGMTIAHMLAHAWFSLHAYQGQNLKVEEGMCQVVAYIWLQSQMYRVPEEVGYPSPSSSSPRTNDGGVECSPTSITAPPKRGMESKFGKKFLEFLKYQIESDSSCKYGDDFRNGYRAVEKFGFRNTLDSTLKKRGFPDI